MEMGGNSAAASPKVVDRQTNTTTDRRNSFMMPFMDSLIDEATSIASALYENWRVSTTGEQLAQLVEFGVVPAADN